MGQPYNLKKRQSGHTPTKTNNSSVKHNIVAGWNDYVQEQKDEALYRHQIWFDNGRPPQGEIALNRRRTRAK